LSQQGGKLERETQAESQPNLATVLDSSELPRARVFLSFAVAVPIVVILGSLVMGGDARAKLLFQAGMAWITVFGATELWLVRGKRVWESRLPRSAHWAIGAIGLVPAIYYFGPFSAVTLAFPLVLGQPALIEDRKSVRLIFALALGMHLMFALPIILGWTSDVGLLSRARVAGVRLAIGELFILGLISTGYALGRWARRTSAEALAELDDARRIIGDQRQVIVEVQERVDQVNRAKTGRWTGQVVGRWQLGPVLGHGGMGEVYDARDAEGREAAVKVLAEWAEESPSNVERFNRELQVAARLQSPHIVQVLDVATGTATVPYLAMERLRGVDLAARLRTEVRMPLADVVGMLEQVARGLEVAHEAGVVHRDLKPHNLFLHDATCWKILDFGVAKVFGIEGTLTQNAMVGTPQYMAPEQATGEAVTHLSDIYALGAIAYRCITGRVPHQAQNLTSLVYQVTTASPARPGTLAEVTREVEDVLAVAMARDPRRRFLSAWGFAEQLAAAAAGRPPKVQPPADAWA